MNKIALVFGNGNYENKQFYTNILNENKGAFIIAVDGGYDFLKKLNIKPNLLIGDLDSIQSSIPEIKILKAPSEKDETDTRLTLDFCKKNNFKKIILLGMLSTDRLDHSLVNLLLLEKYIKLGLEIELLNPTNQIFCAQGPYKKEFLNKKGRTISIIPLSDRVEGLTLEGVKYSLKDKNINRELADLTVSNIIIENIAYIKFTKGIILIDLVNKKED